ncbi:sodium:calcium antiporter [Vibrio ulleungensis]|uniref:Sodium/calcium exchanger membrane region domain-containing protein n=1 Tax=Vibrio ulleungensis TaxID=2807619 RepID=A0ABS2HAX3_9VIBR|nr:hypothetical protein [Vibrio ulleungensis]MBM7034770.1 hypothetical protein [Vibrio ulleungensis]
MVEILIPFLAIISSCYLLKYSCDTFEQSAAYLGRKLPPGIKGATVNAVGSSMPEMFVVISFLFWFNDPDMVMVGLGVTAGSAIFNGCVIPALSILMAKDENGKSVSAISLDKGSLLRDVFWVLSAEIMLVVFLGFSQMTLWMALALNACYLGYAIHLYVDSKRNSDSVDEEEYEYEEIKSRGFFINILTFNFNALLFKNKEFSLARAIAVLSLSIIVIASASHLLADGVIDTADVLGVPDFFAGLIFGAAASSIPDLILSVKDAKNGDYEDAVANPLASNTFDTTVAFALPLCVWFLLNGKTELAMQTGEDLNILRWSIIGITVAVACSLLFNHKKVTKSIAFLLLTIFAAWAGSMFYII